MKKILILFVLVACSPQAPAWMRATPGASLPPPPEASSVAPDAGLDEALAVWIHLRARRGRVALAVSPGDTLHTNDYVELRVAVNTKAYVYVVQWFANGNLTVLFPDRGDVALSPNVWMRIPPAPSDWYQLDDNVGIETVYVIASRESISRIDEALGKELHALRDTDAMTAPAPEATPPVWKPHVPSSDADPSQPPLRSPRPRRMLTMANRGLRKVVEFEGHLAIDTVAPIKDDRLVVASFSFTHAR